MEKLTVYLGEVRRTQNIGSLLSFVISPDIGESAVVDKFYKDILSNNPAYVRSSIERIESTDIPLHIAAQGLKAFIEKPEFHQKSPYELTAFNHVRHDDPADSHIHFANFFDTVSPFAESENYLALTRKGLDRIRNKAQQPRYSLSRSYQKDAVEACFIASSELIASSMERTEDPVPDDFLQACSFGSAYSNFFELFGTDGPMVYKKSEYGINLLYKHGSLSDQQAIDHIRHRLGFSTGI